jgi:Ubiquitin carboxyl-terminal hydrolase
MRTVWVPYVHRVSTACPPDDRRIPAAPYGDNDIQKTYEMISGIFHIGDNCNSGHYIAYIRHDNNWIQADDLYITRNLQWPKQSRLSKIFSKNYSPCFLILKEKDNI